MAKNSGEAITLKLIIDQTTQRVVFAEAGKDFVDFIFGLLQLPLGSIIGHLWEKGMAGSGSLGRIYGSAIKLQPTHFLNNLRKHSLLKPPIPSSSSSSFSSSHPFSLGSGSETTNHYGNPSHLFGSTFTTTRYSFNSPIFGVDQVPSFPGFGSPSNGSPSKKVNNEDGFVKDMQQYMVKDDLTVEPVSTISIVKLLKRFGVEGISCLEEKTVFIDSNKALELVRASFASDTVLTDVFVKNLIDV